MYPIDRKRKRNQFGDVTPLMSQRKESWGQEYEDMRIKALQVFPKLLTCASESTQALIKVTSSAL